MKIAGILIISLLALLGIGAGLLFTKVIPPAALAAKSPVIASALKACGLYHPVAKKNHAAVMASAKSIPSAADAALDTERQQISAEQSQIDQERADLRKRQAQAASAAAAPAMPAASVPLPSKLADIYDTMGSDDLAHIFAKQPDSEVVRALNAMDERKAGKVMAALPPDRAAKIAALMGQNSPSGAGQAQIASSAAVPSQPLASIP